MKVALFIILAATAYTTSAVPIGENELDITYSRYIDFIDDIGEKHVIDLQAEPDKQYVDEMLKNPASNMYLLYTRRNQFQPQQLFLNNVLSVQSSNFNPDLPIIVFSHGWTQDHNSYVNLVLRNVFLAKSDANIIILDWSWLSKQDYVSAVYGLPAVGRALGQFLSFLVSSTGASYDNIHLTGFSLGTHLVANAGRAMEGRAARLTAFDPSGPLWHFNSDRLTPHDAQYVEAIHTDGNYALGGLGIGTAIAQVDWFPNGGMTQPGCFTNLCNHDRAWEYFAATVTYDHLIGRKCTNMFQMSFNMCQGESFPMGNYDLKKQGSGIFRVNTASRYPF